MINHREDVAMFANVTLFLLLTALVASAQVSNPANCGQLSGHATSGTPSSSTYCRGDGTWATPAGGGGSPGGSNTQVQYNNSAAFGGVSGATSDGTTLSVTEQSQGDASGAAASDSFVARAIPAWQNIPIAVCQGSGPSLAGNVITATSPTATCISGSTTVPQHGGASFGTAGAVGTGSAQEFQLKVPDNYAGNHAFIIEYDWYNPTDTNTGHTVTWGGQYVSVTPPGLSGPTFNSSANATATAINGTAGSTTTVQQTFSPAAGATAVAGGDDFYIRIFLSAKTATDAPVLIALRIKWL